MIRAYIKKNISMNFTQSEPDKPCQSSSPHRWALRYLRFPGFFLGLGNSHALTTHKYSYVVFSFTSHSCVSLHGLPEFPSLNGTPLRLIRFHLWVPGRRLRILTSTSFNNNFITFDKVMGNLFRLISARMSCQGEGQR